MRNALAVSRTLLAVFAPRVLRVSAAARRGAAAYADGDQRMVRARTHQSGLVSPPQSEIRWAFLHNFLRTCRWHLPPSTPHTPGEVTPTRELTGVMVRARVAKPPQARRSPFEPAAGEEKFLGKKALFIGKSLTKLSGAAEARQVAQIMCPKAAQEALRKRIKRSRRAWRQGERDARIWSPR